MTKLCLTERLSYRVIAAYGARPATDFIQEQRQHGQHTVSDDAKDDVKGRGDAAVGVLKVPLGARGAVQVERATLKVVGHDNVFCVGAGACKDSSPVKPEYDSYTILMKPSGKLQRFDVSNNREDFTLRTPPPNLQMRLWRRTHTGRLNMLPTKFFMTTTRAHVQILHRTSHHRASWQ